MGQASTGIVLVGLHGCIRTLHPEGTRGMSTATLGDVIAERELEHLGDASARILVRIGKPTEDSAEGRDWRCPFQIIGLDDNAVHEAFGVDAVQALQLCFQMIDAHLYGQPVTWLGEKDLGFYPVNFNPSESEFAADDE